jgi:uncharacterized protein YecT (DUF1311 family)
MPKALFLLFLVLAQSITLASDKPPALATDSAALQPCAAAKTPGAANECFSALYVSTDAHLNATYNHVVAAMKFLLMEAQRHNDAAQIAHHQAALDRLLAAQRAWLNYRDLHCDSVKFQYEGGTISPTVWSQCMMETSQQRIAALSTSYDLGS